MIFKSEECIAIDASSCDACSPGVDCQAYYTNWSYYLMGQALLAFVVFLITVIGKYNVQGHIQDSAKIGAIVV